MLNSSSIVVVVAILLLFSLRIFILYIFILLLTSFSLFFPFHWSFYICFSITLIADCTTACCYSFVSFFTYHISSFLYISAGLYPFRDNNKKWWYSDIFCLSLSFVENGSCMLLVVLLLLVLLEMHSVVSVFFSPKNIPRSFQANNINVWILLVWNIGPNRKRRWTSYKWEWRQPQRLCMVCSSIISCVRLQTCTCSLYSEYWKRMKILIKQETTTNNNNNNYDDDDDNNKKNDYDIIKKWVKTSKLLLVG